MLIFIDRQHAGKPKRPSDRGAGQDLDGDGKVSWWEKEAIWTGKLAIELEILLLEMGYDVIPLSDGSYQTRHARVNNYAMGNPDCIYLALHLNAGGGDYGSFFYYHGSIKGKDLAGHMADSLHQYLGGLENARAIPCQADNWTKNAFHTIKGVVRPVAICCEPIFMDTHKQYLTDDGIKQIALGIAQRIKSWVLQ